MPPRGPTMLGHESRDSVRHRKRRCSERETGLECGVWRTEAIEHLLLDTACAESLLLLHHTRRSSSPESRRHYPNEASAAEQRLVHRQRPETTRPQRSGGLVGPVLSSPTGIGITMRAAWGVAERCWLTTGARNSSPVVASHVACRALSALARPASPLRAAAGPTRSPKSNASKGGKQQKESAAAATVPGKKGAKGGNAPRAAASGDADVDDDVDSGDDDTAGGKGGAPAPLPDGKTVAVAMAKHVEFLKRELSKLRGATASPSAYLSCR
jgi:hypothetical protein